MVETDILQSAVQAIRATGGSRSRLEAALRMAQRTDSPIEAIFATWFVAARDCLVAEQCSRFMLALQPQMPVTIPDGPTYRLDFGLVPMDPWLCDALLAAHLSLRIGVELDGHEFHERTPQQVAHRNRRDRDLSALKWRVLHFSGAELHRNPMAVVVDVLVAGADALDQAKAALLHA